MEKFLLVVDEEEGVPDGGSSCNGGGIELVGQNNK